MVKVVRHGAVCAELRGEDSAAALLIGGLTVAAAVDAVTVVRARAVQRVGARRLAAALLRELQSRHQRVQIRQELHHHDAQVIVHARVDGALVDGGSFARHAILLVGIKTVLGGQQTLHL